VVFELLNLPPGASKAMALTFDQSFQGIGQRYSPRAPLPLLAFRDNHEAALPVQPGKVVMVQRLPEDERFVLVLVDGQEFHAFASDLLECCDALGDYPGKQVGLLLTASVAA
jgi:hypothetical protein